METAAGETPLRRAISSRMLLIFVVGDILGAGIYALVGEVGAEVGGAIWTAFLAAFVLAVFTAFAYAELVTKYPRAAGSALYVNQAYRQPFLTFMVAFAVMASGITSASTLSRAFAGDYFKEFIDLPLVLVALGAILVVAAINMRGIAESVKVNVLLTLVEVGGLILIVVIGAAALGQGDADFGRNFEFKEGESVVLAIMGGASLAFYALIGFEDSVNVAEEARDPTHAFPRALFGGLLIAGAIYMLVTLTASMVVETGELSGSSGPLLEVVRQGPLGISTKLFSFIALLAVINGALINMIMASRLVYGMSRQGIVPEVFGRVLSQRRTPHVAIAFTTLLAVILITTGDLSELADTTVLLLLFVFTIVNVTVLVLRRDPVDHEHFRAPSILPVLGALVSAALIIDTATDDSQVFVRAGLLLLLGALLWGINRLISGPVDHVDPEVLR
ncbi:MAG TPA: APC family permease [Thermoleophilaceae bacterium]|nr:APC family permease [Thermoleophilaceae bacterium]